MNIVITGASRGIGYETVKCLAQNAEVRKILVVSRNEEGLRELQRDCKHLACEIIPMLYDITRLTDGGDSFVKQIMDIVPHVSVLINNAGLLTNKPFDHCSYEDALRQFNTNLFAPALLIKALLPLMQNRDAHIVNIGSMGGYQGSSKFAGLAYYSASKAALACLTECLAVELKPYQIKINCLALGAVQTEMLAEAFPQYAAPLSATQMGKYIAQFALHGSSVQNGQVLPISLSTP